MITQLPNTVPETAGPVGAKENYLNAGHTVASWLLTTDHKRIGILYLIAIIFFFAIATFAAALMRLELLTPAGDLDRGPAGPRPLLRHDLANRPG